MKRYLLLYFIVFTFLLGCAPFRPPVRKPDSSISADYQKILGHWWTQGEDMFIEERNNRLSIQMKRAKGYNIDPSGQYT